MENEEQVELSFTRIWDASLEGKYVPLNIDKRLLLALLEVFKVVSKTISCCILGSGLYIQRLFVIHISFFFFLHECCYPYFIQVCNASCFLGLLLLCNL